MKQMTIILMRLKLLFWRILKMMMKKENNFLDEMCLKVIFIYYFEFQYNN